MNVLDNLQWRYATKRMNGHKVPAEKLERILEAIRLAPTSIGLQPFTVFVIEDKATRGKIAPAIYNQPQITEGSHVLVFAAWKDYSPEKIDAYLDQMATLRSVEVSALNGLKSMIVGAVSGKSPEGLLDWNMRQAYIAFGVAIVAAAEEKVDATPMEGFDADALDIALGLNEKGLHSAVVLALGYRDEKNDHMNGAAKVRREKEKLFVRI